MKTSINFSGMGQRSNFCHGLMVLLIVKKENKNFLNIIWSVRVFSILQRSQFIHKYNCIQVDSQCFWECTNNMTLVNNWIFYCWSYLKFCRFWLPPDLAGKVEKSFLIAVVNFIGLIIATFDVVVVSPDIQMCYCIF